MGFVTFLYFLTPFLKFRGQPLLRIDIKAGALFAFGGTVPFTDLFPLLLALLALLFGFLFIATAFGRLWCGWGCPQTILLEFAEMVFLSPRMRSRSARVILHILFLALSVFLAMIGSLYFVDVSVFLPPKFLLDWGWGSGSFLAMVAAFYFDMVLVRRVFCEKVCPYGVILTAITDESGLRVAIAPGDIKECLQCAACVAACPMDLDVRKGTSQECLQCGLCVEACNKRFEKVAPEGIIHYFTGKGEGRGGHVFSARSSIPLAAALLLAAAFIVTARTTPDVRFSVRRNVNATFRVLEDGSQAHFFKVRLHNERDVVRKLKVKVSASDGGELVVKGLRDLNQFGPGESRELPFVVILTPDNNQPRELVFELTDESGKVVGVTRLSQETER